MTPKYKCWNRSCTWVPKNSSFSGVETSGSKGIPVKQRPIMGDSTATAFSLSSWLSGCPWSSWYFPPTHVWDEWRTFHFRQTLLQGLRKTPALKSVPPLEPSIFGRQKWDRQSSDPHLATCSQQKLDAPDSEETPEISLDALLSDQRIDQIPSSWGQAIERLPCFG